MQHFQLILIVIGVFAIAAVLIHGFIVSRKEKKLISDDLPDNEDSVSTEDNSDSRDGIVGDVRIIRTDNEDEYEDCAFAESSSADEPEQIDFAKDLSEPAADELAQSIDSEQQLSKFEDVDDAIEPDAEFSDEPDSQQAATKKPEPVQEQQDHFVFNVAAREGKTVRGHELLQFFLTAGFRFGEMSIFHRHLHSDGTGPVLFSIANMMKPGVFDPENMEQFSSEGVTFFLTAPNNDINIKEAFDMMVVAVEQMAEEFDCEVLNGARKPLTEEQYRDYHKRLSRYI